MYGMDFEITIFCLLGYLKMRFVTGTFLCFMYEVMIYLRMYFDDYWD